MIVNIKGEEYEYFDDIVNDEKIRNNFIQFIYDSFDWNFEKWYRAGYWSKKYEPHVLVKHNQVVSTVTVNHMKYLWGKEKEYIQIGGVLTREEYYKKGLASWLMNHIVERYRDKCEQIFLFSDDCAMEFYPKVGYKKIIEYSGEYVWKRKKGNKETLKICKMNVENIEEQKKLIQCYKQSNPFSIFPSIDCEELVVFYGLEFKKDCYYYFPELDMTAVVEVRENELFINDIYGSTEIDMKTEGNILLDRIIQAILKSNDCDIEEIKVTFGFSPLEELKGITLKPIIEIDDTTFILADKENIFEKNKLRFPILSHN